MLNDFPSYDEILSKEFLSNYKTRHPNWGFNGLGYLIYLRTYSRTLEDGSKEEWWQTVERCVRGAQRLGAMYTSEEAERIYDYIFNLKCFYSGRGMWQLGTSLVHDIGWMDSLISCWGTTVSSIDDLCFIFMESMFGGGVGPNVSKEFTFELPRVIKGVKCRFKNTKDADYIVPDSKEGWRDLWHKLLEAYLITGRSFTYSTVCIRPEGEPLKTFGGIAPGPRPLIKGSELLCNLLENREGKKLRTSDVCDIICIGGEIVKSGGVRRTALCLQGDPDDVQFLMLKRWDLGNIPYYRSNSNNTILSPHFSHITDKFWQGYKGNGECYGLINLRNARRYGRIDETKWEDFNLVEPNIIAGNPCQEAMLEDKESCNLSDVCINNVDSLDELIDIVKLLYKYNKAVCSGNYYHKASNDIIHRNMKIGIGLTGICQKLDVIDEWADIAYRELRKFDKEWSKIRGWPQSIRLTCIKPSGTLSLLSGSTPGVHPGFSKYHIRRVRFGSNDPLIPLLKEMGINLEYEVGLDGNHRHDVLVAEFPCKFEENTIVSDQFSASDQLNLMVRMSRYWADQAVSQTVYFDTDNLEEIQNWLKDNYDKYVKTVSFLPKVDHGFCQAPLEEITKEQYDKMIKKIKPIQNLLNSNTINVGNELIENMECTNGHCPIR